MRRAGRVARWLSPALLLTPLLAVGLVVAVPGGAAFAAPVSPTYTGGGGVTIAPAPLTVPPSVGLTSSGLLQAAFDVSVGAVGLYASSDTWLPWFTGLFAQEEPEVVGNPKNAAAPCQAGFTWGQNSTYAGTFVTTARTNPSLDDGTGSEAYGVTSSLSCGSAQTSTAGSMNFPVTTGCKSVGSSGTTYTSVTQGIWVRTRGVPGSTNGTIPGCSAGYVPTHVVIEGIEFLNAQQTSYPTLSYMGGWDLEQSTFRTEVTCRKADGTTQTITKEVTGVTGPKVPACDAAYIGSHGESVIIKGGAPGTTGPSLPKLGTIAAPTTSVEYDNCIGAGKSCRLRIYYRGEPCSLGMDGCTSWLQGYVARPLDYECKWGTYVMPIADCAVLERAYKSGAGANVAHDPRDTDGDHETTSPQQATTTATPAPTTSPGTGTGTGSSPMPTSGANPTAPAVEPGAATEASSQSCYAAAWSWNPVDWVYVPVKCALKWAFVPTGGTWTATMGDAGAFGDWKASPFGEWNTATGNVVGAFAGFDDSAAGCEGPALTGDVMGVGYSLKPLAACTDPMANVAAVTKGLLTVIVGFGGAFLIIDPVFAALGLGVKPRMEQGTLF